jgi:hypothetical protein
MAALSGLPPAFETRRFAPLLQDEVRTAAKG